MKRSRIQGSQLIIAAPRAYIDPHPTTSSDDVWRHFRSVSTESGYKSGGFARGVVRSCSLPMVHYPMVFRYVKLFLGPRVLRALQLFVRCGVWNSVGFEKVP